MINIWGKTKKRTWSLALVFIMISIIFSLQTINCLADDGKVNINGVWYDSFEAFYEASGYTYITKDELINNMINQYNTGGTVSKSYYYEDDLCENLIGLMINDSGLYNNFASMVYRYTIRTTAGKKSVGGYQVMCYETDTTTQMYLDDTQFNAMSAKAREVLNSCRGSDNAETVLNVFNWFKDNVTYDYSYSHGNAYDALIGQNSVCAGISTAFQYMMEIAGIPSVIVTDDGKNQMAHAWNAVKINDYWYYVDCTNGLAKQDDSMALFAKDIMPDYYGIGIASTSYKKPSSKPSNQNLPIENENQVLADTAVVDNAAVINTGNPEFTEKKQISNETREAVESKNINKKLYLMESRLDFAVNEITEDTSNEISDSAIVEDSSENQISKARFSRDLKITIVFTLLVGIGISVGFFSPRRRVWKI